MRVPFCFGFAAAAAAAAFGQDISVSGTVSDAAGKPLAGAIVTLLAARLSDTTGADGIYDFTGKAIGVLPRSRSGGLRRNGSVSREVAFPWGRAFAPAENRAGFTGASAPGPLFDAWGRRLSLLYPAETFTEPGPAAATTPSAARKPAAAGVDWLQAYKSGYAPEARAIDLYSGSYALTLSPLQGPDFGPNVILFDPAQPMATMQGRMDAILANQAKAQFGNERYAFLFKPGAYNLNADLGFYTQALGLGLSPDDVAITGAARSTTTTANNNVTLQFWRACENLSVTPSTGLNPWAVSQGAPYRRVHVKGSLALSLGGWASGGFLADSKIDKDVGSGSQQQWFTRNSEIGSWSGGVWNMTFVGVTGAPVEAWPTKPYTVIPAAPVVREKPFLYLDKDGAYGVFLPALRKAASGASWTKGPAAGESVPIGMFHIAHAGADDAASLNAALAGGKHLLLTPGIYHLDRALQVGLVGAVVLGLGMATLVADNGTAALEIADVDGVRIAGIVIDAGAAESAALLQVGPPGAAADHAANPTSLHDVFIRVGGPRPGLAAATAVIRSNDVIADHFWLWRADHGQGAGWANNLARNGLVVEGDRVTCYGMFVEHYQAYQTLWNGEGGRMYFYQSEMPYDPPSQEAWSHDGVNGYASYKVGAQVKTHEAWGVGVYCAFRAGPIQSDHAVEAPVAAGVQVRHAVAIWLNGVDGSGIGNVLNGTGGAVTKGKTKATVD